jgi:hypothetical protein
MKRTAELIFELARELGCTPYAIVDSLVGMEMSEEQASELKELISNRAW